MKKRIAQISAFGFWVVTSVLSRIASEVESRFCVFIRTDLNGVIFYDLAFLSELEFMRYYSSMTTMGKGSAAFVDIVSIWVFASMEQVSTLDWLQTYQKLVATGFTNKLETQYTNSMNNRYPVPFVGLDHSDHKDV